MSRKARPFRERRVARANVRPKEVVMIVCEGEKTEPSYFEAVRRELRLQTASVKVFGRECGSSPATVVEFAVQQLKRNGEYDAIYCVFDRDQHPDYNAAIERCRSLRQKNESGEIVKFLPITSDPCFEYWLILHFEDTQAPYAAGGGRSVGEVAERRLRQHLASYKKGDADVFAATKDNSPLAARRSRRAEEAGCENPHTKVYRLLFHLTSMAENRPAWAEKVFSVGVPGDAAG